MFPKRKKFGFFDWDDDFDKIFESMEDMMRDLMEKAERGEIKQYGPFVYGFSARITPEGKVIVDEFGNTAKGKEGEIGGEREPMTDIISEKDEIIVIAELPGVNKEDIKLTIDEKTMGINVDTAERKYSKVLRLPAVVNPKSAKAHYKNGVLEVRIKKIKKEEPKGYEVKVD
ncbi:MAG: archaeal heat shock protein Hsp20 [Candidatus Micrarchaeia archaeon]